MARKKRSQQSGASIKAGNDVNIDGSVAGRDINITNITNRTQERRLEAHQQAHALWRELLANVHNEDSIGEIVLKCQSWWENNCLYLEPKARESFRRSFMCALDHSHFVKNRTNPELVKQNWADIMAAGKAIQESEIIEKGA